MEPQQWSASLCETVAHEGNVEAVPGSASKAAAATCFRGDPNLRAAGTIHSAPGRKLSVLVSKREGSLGDHSVTSCFIAEKTEV